MSDISPKVRNPVLGIAGFGGILTALAAGLSNQRMRLVGATMLLASAAVGAIGWASRDPQREPFIEPGFVEPDPELAEHRASEQDR